VKEMNGAVQRATPQGFTRSAVYVYLSRETVAIVARKQEAFDGSRPRPMLDCVEAHTARP